MVLREADDGFVEARRRLDVVAVLTRVMQEQQKQIGDMNREIKELSDLLFRSRQHQ